MADDSACKPACLSQFVFYPQQDPDDCGVSVLRMVARYHGLSVSNARIREASGVPYGELSLLALSRAARKFGLNTLSLRLRSEELDQLSQWPAIAHTQGQHYVLIEKITSHRVHLSDPAYGRYTLTRGEFIERWVEQGRGVLLVLEPGLHFRPVLIEDEKPEKSPLRLPPIGFNGILMVVLHSILLIVFFQLLRSLLQIGSLPAESLMLLGGFSIFTWLAYALVRYRWSSLSKQRVNSWMINLDRQIADRPHTLPEYEWDSERETRWIARSESRRFMRSNAQAYLSGIRGSLQTVILGLYLCWLYLPAGALFAGFVLGYFFVRKLQAKRLMGLAILAFERRISEQCQSWFLDASAEWQLLSNQKIEEDQHASAEESVENPSGLFWLIPLSWLLVLAFLALVSDNAIQSFDVIALVGVIGFYGCYLGMKGLQSRAIRQMLLPGYEGLGTSDQDVAPGQKIDELMLVSQDEEEGLKIFFHLPARSTILIFGEDHPTRSLMVNQLAGIASGEDRQLATSSGSFTKGQLSQWRQERMLIRHSSILPVAPIGELITGQSDYRADDMELDTALKDSLLYDLIKGWPHGLDTILAFQSIHSQTLIYQVLVARALFQRPNWLILDEVFRHLDPFQEQVILENLVQARQGLSTVIVSRRLEMAGQVDWIIHTREGTILEEGKFAQLMEDEGYLYSLITSS